MLFELSASMAAKLLLRLTLLCGLPGGLALCAQLLPGQEALGQGEPAPIPSDFHFHTYLMPQPAASHISLWPFGFTRAYWKSSPSTIYRMEAAFYCNDTPFVDQVRLPLATFWNGRVKLTGFESDVTTANFVLGLPGQGSLHSLSAFGNAFIATHTPPSDQLAGINMTFSLRPREAGAFDNSGRRGIEYLIKAGRDCIPFLSARSDSISVPAR
jgi:hypothetical protein